MYILTYLQQCIHIYIYTQTYITVMYSYTLTYTTVMYLYNLHIAIHREHTNLLSNTTYIPDRLS